MSGQEYMVMDCPPPSPVSPIPMEVTSVQQHQTTPRKKQSPMSRCRTRLVEIMTPQIPLDSDPILMTSGELMNKVIKATGRSQAKSAKQKLKDYRGLLRKHVERMQMIDLDNANAFYTSIIKDVQCEMTLNFMHLIHKEILQTIKKCHNGILTEFKIFPNIDHQKHYSDQLVKVAYGWRMTNFLDKTDKVITNYGHI